MFNKTFIIFGTEFTISTTKFDSFDNQGLHFLIHAALAFIHPLFSLGAAIGIEVRDGEHGGEGFNIFPDLVFRLLGVGAIVYLLPFIEGFIK